MFVYLAIATVAPAAAILSYRFVFEPIFEDMDGGAGQPLRVIGAVMVGLAVLLLAGAAFAEGVDAAPPETLNGLLAQVLDMVRPVIVDIAVLVLTTLAGWAATRFSSWTGMQIEERHRQALQSALANAAAAGGGTNAMIAYVRKSVPDAIRNFGLDDDRLFDLLKPHMARLAA